MKSKLNEKMVPLEEKIVSSIMKGLKASGVRFIVKTHGSIFQMAGLPDLIFIAPKFGRFVGMEVKRPIYGVVSELQKAILRKINQAGGYGCVVYNLEEALAALHRADVGESVPSQDSDGEKQMKNL